MMVSIHTTFSSHTSQAFLITISNTTMLANDLSSVNSTTDHDDTVKDKKYVNIHIILSSEVLNH